MSKKVVVLVTGRLAEDRVKRVARELSEALGVEVKVLALPIAVAVLATPSLVEHHLLKELGPDLRDRVLAVVLPGGVPWSCRILSDRLGVRVVKGTKHIDDLLDAIKELGVEGLSPDEPADNLVKNLGVERARRILEELEAGKQVAFRVCDVDVPVRPPPFRIVVEVLDAWRRSVEEVVEECRRFLESGASIVSLDLHGASASDAKSIASRVVSRLGKPVAVDAPPRVALAACLGGAEMVMNADARGLEVLKSVAKEGIAVTVVPTTTGELPRDARARVDAVKRGVERARELGFEKILVDPILDPPVVGSITASLAAYSTLSRELPGVPMLMGVANVVELMDADSVGLNALLAVLALEVGASVLLTVEASPKTRGSVRELFVATTMVSIARRLERPPKDLGVSLLVLKEKRVRDQPLPRRGEYDEFVEVGEVGDSWELDPLGVFRFFVDRERGRICALYMGRKGRLLLCGRRAKDVAKEIVSRGLVSRLDHATYIGRELAKAEEALRVGRSYVQDEPLFPELDTLVKRLSSHAEGRGEGGG